MGVRRDDAGFAWKFLAVTTGSDTGSFSCWVTVLEHGDTWRFDVNSLAKIDRCIVELLIRRSGPEIQVVALDLALEATECVLGKVRRE